MTRPASRSSRSAQLAVCSGENTSTSWMPLAGACTCTGPRLRTASGIVAVERGVAVRHDPHDPPAVAAVGLQRRGRGLLVAGAERARAASGQPRPGWLRGAKSVGRSARSATTVTQRPFSGFKRS